jgi:hypothetical protein
MARLIAESDDGTVRVQIVYDEEIEGYRAYCLADLTNTDLTEGVADDVDYAADIAERHADTCTHREERA